MGHLLHKGPVLWLTYLETEVTGSFAFPRDAQAACKLRPMHLNCPPYLGDSGHLGSQEYGAYCGLSLLECSWRPRGEDRQGFQIGTLRIHIFPGTWHRQGLDVRMKHIGGHQKITWVRQIYSRSFEWSPQLLCRKRGVCIVARTAI